MRLFELMDNKLKSFVKESHADIMESGNSNVIHMLSWDDSVTKMPSKSFDSGYSKSFLPNVTPSKGGKTGKTITPFSQVLTYFDIFLEAASKSKYTDLSKEQMLSWAQEFQKMNPTVSTKMDKLGDVFKWMGMIGNIDYELGADSYVNSYVNSYIGMTPRKEDLIDKLPEDYQDIRKISMLALNLPDDTKEYRKYLPFRALFWSSYGEYHIHFNVLGKEDLGSFSKTLAAIIQKAPVVEELRSGFFHEFTHYLQKAHRDSFKADSEVEYYENYMYVQSEVEAHAYQYASEVRDAMYRGEWERVSHIFNVDKHEFMNKMYDIFYHDRISDIKDALPKNPSPELINFFDVLKNKQNLKDPKNQKLALLLYDVFENAHKELMKDWDKLKNQVPSAPKNRITNISNKIETNTLWSIIGKNRR